MGNLISFMKEVAEGLRKSGNYGTAHVYRSSMNAIIAFNGSRNLPFKKVNQEFLKSFETYLREKDCSWNTVSTYMRTLRAVYNRAVDRRMASYIPHHFRYVYTGTRADRKRALEKEDMERLMKELPKQIHQGRGELQRTRAYFFLMFMLRGMPFVDLAYLKKQDIVGNVLTYRRRKTGRLLTVTLLPETMKLRKKYMNTDSASPYLFPILTGGESTEATYREYQIALRNFNYQLLLLKQVLALTSDLSSYTARHTWATMAYYCEIHPGIISEAMGHSSIIVTETYLKPFKNKKIDEANVTILSSLKRNYVCGK